LAHAKPQARAPENGCDNNVTKSANVKSPIQIRDKKEVRVRESKQQFESTAAQPVAVQVYFLHHQPTNLKYHSWSAQFQGVCKKHLHSKKL
jgi:hypothetical protein